MRDQIISGDRRPGSPLTPARIAEEHKVSPGTVTRALGTLAAQGLIRNGPRGYIVATSFNYVIRPGTRPG